MDVFETDGTFVRRFASHGALNSPWGLALAPDSFGKFSHHLLVGNFGDERINAFDVGNGDFDGQLIDPEGNPLTINGLWALKFGNGAKNGAAAISCSSPLALATRRMVCSASSRPDAKSAKRTRETNPKTNKR